MAEATGLEPARAMRGDLANRCHTVRRRLQKNFELQISDFGVLEEGTGVEPASDKRAVVFGTTALPVRLPFRKNLDLNLARTLRFELRTSILETDGLPVSLHP